MKLTGEMVTFIKSNRVMLTSIMEELNMEYLNRVVDEKDSEKKAVLSLFVEEFRSAMIMINNLSNQKEIKNKGGESTGI